MGVGKEGSQAGLSFGQGLTHQGQLLGRQRCSQAVRRSEGTWGRCWDSWHCIRRANCVLPHAKLSDKHACNQGRLQKGKKAMDKKVDGAKIQRAI